MDSEIVKNRLNQIQQELLSIKERVGNDAQCDGVIVTEFNALVSETGSLFPEDETFKGYIIPESDFQKRVLAVQPNGPSVYGDQIIVRREIFLPKLDEFLKTFPE